MYAKHFNFIELPFSIAPNPRYVYLSPQHQEALAHLLYGIGMGGGFVVLTGEVGTGKTTLCRCLLESVPEDVEVAVIFNPRLNSRELLAAICDELRIPYPQQRNSVKLLIDLLNHHLLAVHARGKRTVVLIDEAQNLSFDVLEQIRLLTNLETNETKLLQIILVGQPELNNLLQRRNLRQLSQRITARYHLRPLYFRETVAYIQHRIAVAGGRRKVFGTLATALIHRLSGGIPRVINLICDRAMLGAYTLGKTEVGCFVVRKAAAEVLPDNTVTHVSRLGAWAAVMTVLLAGFFYYSVWTRNDMHLMATKAPKDKAAAQTADIARSRTERAMGNKPVTETAARTAPPPTVGELIVNPDLTRKAAMARLFDFWRLPLSADSGDACVSALRKGWRCQLLACSWVQLRSLDTAAVLTFELDDGSKRYATLAGIHNEKARLFFNERSYDVASGDILPYWRGEALLLWKPPFDNVQPIKPGDAGLRVKWLRQQLGAVAPADREGHFDAGLQTQVMAFQKEHGLFPDGVVGTLTLIHLSRKAQASAVSVSGSSEPNTKK